MTAGEKVPTPVKKYHWYRDGMWCADDPLPGDPYPITGKWVSAADYDGLRQRAAGLEARVSVMQSVINAASVLIGRDEDEEYDNEDDYEAMFKLREAILVYRAALATGDAHPPQRVHQNCPTCACREPAEAPLDEYGRPVPR